MDEEVQVEVKLESGKVAVVMYPRPKQGQETGDGKKEAEEEGSSEPAGNEGSDSAWLVPQTPFLIPGAAPPDGTTFPTPISPESNFSSIESCRQFTKPVSYSGPSSFSLERGSVEVSEIRIGKGSFGSVFLGKMTIDGKEVTVAIKDNSFVIKDGAGKALTDESEVYRKVSPHEHIVEFLGSHVPGADDPNSPDSGNGGGALVLEYLPKNLHETVLYDPEFKTFGDVVRTLHGIAVALVHLHENMIVHFDLKPANVLLTNDNVPKVADFGVSKVRLRNSITASIRGTRGYIAPELMIGGWANAATKDSQEGNTDDTVRVTDTVDIFSFGVIGYFCVTGGIKKDKEIEDQTIKEGKSVVFGGIKSAVMPCDCPEELRTLIGDCLKFDLSKITTKNHGRPTPNEAKKRLEDMMQESWMSNVMEWKTKFLQAQTAQQH